MKSTKTTKGRAAVLPRKSDPLAPFAEVLAAEGFTVCAAQVPRETDLDGIWEVAPDEHYLAVVRPAPPGFRCYLTHFRARAATPLILPMQLDTPEELRWLLRRCVALADARNAVGAPRATPQPVPAPRPPKPKATPRSASKARKTFVAGRDLWSSVGEREWEW